MNVCRAAELPLTKQMRLQNVNAMFVVGGVSSPASGIASAVSELSSSLVNAGARVTVFAADTGRRGYSEFTTHPKVGRITEPGIWAFRLQHSPKSRRRIQKAVHDYDVIHNHSLWVMPTHYSSVAGHQSGKPVVFSSHGYFMESAMRHSSWKKSLAGWLFQRKDLSRCACIHASTKAEIDGIRRYVRKPVIVIPNGVNPGDFNNARTQRQDFLSDCGIPSDKRVLLFLGRLHPIKGIANLLCAWETVCREYRDWHLVFVGPDGGMLHTMQQAMAAEPLKSSTSIVGPLFGQRKCDCLHHANALVLPSISEGFSVTILEAMAARLPVVVSHECNFPEVEQCECGFLTNTNAGAIADGLRRVMSATDGERLRLGQSGRKLVETKYSWPSIAQQMFQLYRWSMGEPSPSSLEIYE